MSGLSASRQYTPAVITTVQSPTPPRAGALIDAGVDDGAFVTAVGECTVTTPEHTLPCARRHVLVKPDGSVVIHNETGITPQATQPPRGTPTVTATDSGIVLTVDHQQAETAFVVSFQSVQHVSVAGDDPNQTTVTETDLKTLVLEQPTVIEPGFQPLATERQTDAGPVDVYGRDKQGRTVVLELKRRRGGPAAVGQLKRYVSALRDELHTDATVRGILVAPSVTDRAHHRLAREGLEFVSLSPTQARL